MAELELIQCLSSTLSPEANTRIAAELRLSELLKSPDAGLALGRIIITHELEMSLRQMSIRPSSTTSPHSAAIILRKYVKEHWSPFFGAFRGDAPPAEIKDQIRKSVFQGLSDSQRRIRTSCALTISEIASCDWPDQYPDLLSSILELLSSGSPDKVHGAMRLFTEFVRNDLSEDQLLPVMRELVPVLLTILGDSKHSTYTRAGSIAVFRQCLISLYMVKDQHPAAVQEATASIIPVWLEAFKVLLDLDISQDVNERSWDGIAIRKELFKTLDVLNTSFPKSLKPDAPHFLSFGVSHLQSLAPLFSKFYISEDAPSVPASSDDDSQLDLMQLVCPIFDFITSTIRSGSGKLWSNTENMDGLVDAVTWWVQITRDDEDSWISNANAFVAQEYDDSLQYSVRIAGFDLLAVIIDRSPLQVVGTFHTTVNKAVTEARTKREGGDPDWWRPLEASLAVIGSQAEDVLSCIEDELDLGREKPINIDYLLVEVIPSFLSLDECPFLQGRGFVFASQFSRLLPEEIAGSYLDAAIRVIENDNAQIPIKVSAVKAIQNFSQNIAVSSLAPLAPRIAKDLGPFLLVTSEDTLTLVLEALSVVVEIEGDWMTTQLAGDLVVAVLDVWTKNVKDPIFISLISGTLETIAHFPSPGVYEALIKAALPSLCQALGSSGSDSSWITGSALDLLTGIIRGADSENGLGEGFFAAIASPLFKCLDGAEDRDVLQNGVSCLTVIIRKDAQQVLAWTDPNTNQSGLASILSFVARLLQSQEESGGLFIGDLIIHLMRKTGEAVLPVLPELLQAMLSRMKTAKTATFIQSLVVPFNFLIHNQRDTIIELLESSNVEGDSGLNVFIQTLCENVETFQGFWPSRVSTLALISLFASERPSLQGLFVKGDIVVKGDGKNVIMTRSRTKKSTRTERGTALPALYMTQCVLTSPVLAGSFIPPAPHEFTRVPFPVKAIKILVHEIQSGGEAASMSAFAGTGSVPELESDDGEDDWAEEDRQNQGFSREEFQMLSEMLGPKGVAFDNDEILDDNDDEDLKNDPISQMDMTTHLIAFFKECASRNTNNFSGIFDQLTIEESLILKQVIES